MLDGDGQNSFESAASLELLAAHRWCLRAMAKRRAAPMTTSSFRLFVDSMTGAASRIMWFHGVHCSQCCKSSSCRGDSSCSRGWISFGSNSGSTGGRKQFEKRPVVKHCSSSPTHRASQSRPCGMFAALRVHRTQCSKELSRSPRKGQTCVVVMTAGKEVKKKKKN